MVNDSVIRLTGHMTTVKRKGVFNAGFLLTADPSPYYVVRVWWKNGVMRKKWTVYTDTGATTPSCPGLSSRWNAKRKSISVTFPQSCAIGRGNSIGAREFNVFLDPAGNKDGAIEVDNIGYMPALLPPSWS